MYSRHDNIHTKYKLQSFIFVMQIAGYHKYVVKCLVVAYIHLDLDMQHVDGIQQLKYLKRMMKFKFSVYVVSIRTYVLDLINEYNLVDELF